MIYREAGQFKSTYASDQAIFPIAQDRWVVLLLLLGAFVVPPLLANEYWLQAVLIPFLIYALAAIGLNLLTGYAGQLSLGTGGFMAAACAGRYFAMIAGSIFVASSTVRPVTAASPSSGSSPTLAVTDGGAGGGAGGALLPPGAPDTRGS